MPSRSNRVKAALLSALVFATTASNACAWYISSPQQQECHQVQQCAQWGSVCTEQETVCVRPTQQCVSYEQVCAQTETQCKQYQSVYQDVQVCSEYGQRCAHWNYTESCQNTEQIVKGTFVSTSVPQKDEKYSSVKKVKRWADAKEQAVVVVPQKTEQKVVPQKTCKRVKTACAKWVVDTNKCLKYSVQKRKVGTKCVDEQQVCVRTTQGKCQQYSWGCAQYGQKCKDYQKVCQQYQWQQVCQDVKVLETTQQGSQQQQQKQNQQQQWQKEEQKQENSWWQK
ncbi:hypothetical protein CDCA_CDCA14G3890 [Cyanidium caldarium]|uniref:Uncharacterized protein n=1 Tax=Cyanidium caldarium TaxID=2771 RepID=A0AAV9J0F3_CYACA|nr:hypothetical protein CDCA_CDCA14G3890 [Cyanidium caldarium]